MANTTLQIPIDKKLKEKATKVASEHGFSSLQEAVRVFLNQYAEKEIGLKFAIPADQRWFWSPEWQAKEQEADEDIKNGNVSGPFKTAEEVIKHLHSLK